MDGLEMIRLMFSVTVIGLLAGCTGPVPPRPATVPMILPASPPAATLPPPHREADAVPRCPTAAEIRRLRAARPKPLRTQPMPASPAERVARTAAQLGLYEARGAWADQVTDALDQCTAD